MQEYENKLKQYIQKNNVDCKHLVFEKSTHTVKEAADAVNASEDQLVKNICFIDENNNLIVAIVLANFRVSTTRIIKILNIDSLRVANIDEILERTGYPCGGTPSFGFNGFFLIDSLVMNKEFVYSGGGSPRSLLKISPKEILRLNNGKVERIRK